MIFRFLISQEFADFPQDRGWDAGGCEVKLEERMGNAMKEVGCRLW